MKTHRLTFISIFTLLMVLCFLSVPTRADAPKPGDKGVISGTVVEVATDFVLIRPAGADLPLRNYFKWAGVKGSKPDPVMKAAVATIKSGDTVEIDWSFDSERRIDAIKSASPSPANPVAVIAPATPAPTTNPATLPAASPAALPAVAANLPANLPPAAPIGETETPALNNVAPAPTTSGEWVNAFIDNLVATGTRLLEVPLFMLLAFVGFMALSMTFAIRRLVRKQTRPTLRRLLLISEAVLAVLLCAFLIDRKIMQLENEIATAKAQALEQRIASRIASQEHAALAPAPVPLPLATAPAPAIAPATVAATPTTKPIVIASAPATIPAPSPATAPATRAVAVAEKRKAFLFDVDETTKALNTIFGSNPTVTLRPVIYDDASDVIPLHFTSPLNTAFMAVIDLKNPAVNILIGATESKSLTTDFAKATNTTIGVNGEAGLSPAPGSGIGQWRGNLVWQGAVLSREDSAIPRPYLSFDKQNDASFTPASQKPRSLASDSYNVIWGRLDALINGVVQDGDPGTRQPRTAMGINKDGTKLYLFEVDGRQQNYSIGFTRGEVAKVLKAFGAYNGMLCDEGGSSCFYVKDLGGILNSPSDGQERPTYTHFGITLKKS